MRTSIKLCVFFGVFFLYVVNCRHFEAPCDTPATRPSKVLVVTVAHRVPICASTCKHVFEQKVAISYIFGKGLTL